MSNMLTPISVPDKVDVKIDNSGVINIKGPIGELQHQVPDQIDVIFNSDDNSIKVERQGNNRKVRALHGLHRSLLANMVEGVLNGFVKQMEIHGTGYTVDEQGKQLIFRIGFCHDVRFDVPEDIKVEVEQRAAQPGNPARFKLTGIDKHELGQFAANIRKVRPPEPYKGKGIRYADERVIRKEGKAFAGLE